MLSTFRKHNLVQHSEELRTEEGKVVGLLVTQARLLLIPVEERTAGLLGSGRCPALGY